MWKKKWIEYGYVSFAFKYTYFIATNYSNGVGSQIPATWVIVLPKSHYKLKVLTIYMIYNYQKFQSYELSKR